MFEATVNVSLKKSILDPQGQTILHALDTMGFRGAKNVRTGKFFVVALESASRSEAEKEVRAICEKVLVNPVIEQYEVVRVEEKGSGAQ